MKVTPNNQQRQTEELAFRANLVALAAALDRARPPAGPQLLEMERFAAIVYNHRAKVGDE
jgi:hypothetical protein